MDFALLLSLLPPELAVFILAMLPVTELRASIPIGVFVYDLPPIVALVWSILGDLIPAYLILAFLGPVAEWLRHRWGLADKVLTWWFDRVYKNFFAKYRQYGPLALALFVAIPLPVTGSWTGATAAWLFKIKKSQAVLYITIGVVIAGVVVTILTVGTQQWFGL
jgi:uncharacterized membrane protein